MNATPSPVRKRCHLAWHVTARCNLACKHCLRRSPSQPVTDLPHDQCMQILESFIQFAKNTNRDAEVEFSGGNPFVREDFLDLLRTTHEYRKAGVVKHIRILGNAETFNVDLIAALKAAEVDEIVLSMDGLGAVNDQMRGRGAFNATLQGIRSLVKVGIIPSVKFTLVRSNVHQVIDVIKLVLTEKVKHFGMGPLILAGGGFHMREQALSPAEYRLLLLELLQFWDSTADTYADFRRSFLTGNRMYALLFHELGRLNEYQALCSSKPGHDRKRGGNVLFVVWSDGEVVLRREMQRQGRVPQDSFLLHLFEDSDFMDRVAREAQLEYVKCRSCPVADFCSPALCGTFGARLLFAPSNHCWR